MKNNDNLLTVGVELIVDFCLWRGLREMKRILSLSKTVLMWACSVTLLLWALIFLPSLGSLIFFVAGVLLLPIKKVQQRIPIKKCKGLIAAVLFVVGVYATPTTPTEDSTAQLPATSPNAVEESVADESDMAIVPANAASVSPEAESTPTPTVKPTVAPVKKPAVHHEDSTANVSQNTDANVVHENSGNTTPAQSAPEVPATTPEPVVTPAPQPEPQGQMVWIPQSGKKYHSHPGCSNMNNPTQVTKEKATQMGYTPCKKCY